MQFKQPDNSEKTSQKNDTTPTSQKSQQKNIKKPRKSSLATKQSVEEPDFMQI